VHYVLGHRRRHRVHSAQVGATVAASGRAHGQEHHLGLAHRRRDVGAEAQQAGGHVLLNHGAQAGLVDGHLAAHERVHLVGSSSTQWTVLPASARQVPVTSPTYPDPTTQIFIVLRI
jgi:hypothetical protein